MKQRTEMEARRIADMAKCRRAEWSMRVIETLAHAANEYAAANYETRPTSVAGLYAATFLEILWLLPNTKQQTEKTQRTQRRGAKC